MIDPNYISGYVDGEGSFLISFSPREKLLTGLEVRSLKNLIEVIIPHFKRYQLLSSKKKDFVIFCKVCEMMRKEKHKKRTGLEIIIDLALKMNKNGSRRYSKEFLLHRLKI